MGANFRWFGTAAFEVRFDSTVVWIDPYLSRNAQARPVVEMQPGDVQEADLIFLTHGHSDHAFDVPAIVRRTGASVYASTVACDTLRRAGVLDSHLRSLDGGETITFEHFTVEVIPSLHVKFDLPLLAKTLWQARSALAANLGLLRDWPPGQVLGYHFTLVGGFTFCHFGSAGYDPDLIERLCPDVALIPLQGNTHIHRIAAEMTALIQPKIVIPHHWDDFYPPISQMVPVEPFAQAVAELSPATEVRVPVMGREMELGQ